MSPTVSPVTGVIDLNPSPFSHFAWNIFCGGHSRYLLVGGVWAASCHNQVNQLSLENRINREYTRWVQ